MMIWPRHASIGRQVLQADFYNGRIGLRTLRIKHCTIYGTDMHCVQHLVMVIELADLDGVGM